MSLWAVEQRRGGVVEAEDRVHAWWSSWPATRRGGCCSQTGSDLRGIAIKTESGVEVARPVAYAALLARFLPALPERF